MPVLRARFSESEVVGIGSSDFDLLSQKGINDMFMAFRPEVVIHLAAYSGGIGANRNFPADFFHRNSLFVSLMFEAAARFGVKKLIYTMGGCSYPAKAISPIAENSMWDGYPQPDSAAYSVAKKIGIVASDAYRRQHGLNSIVLVPGNMYGEYDNFREAESHVVPAMIRRYFEAKLRNEAEITMWGDGSPVRDFVYVGDVAKAIVWFLENYNSSEPVNVSSGTPTTIKELADTIKRQMQWDGEIKWDISKPNGQIIKVFDVSKLRSLGLGCDTPLAEGLERTIRWLEKNYVGRSDGIRL
jgi:GDP-L-fucose synthase